MSTIGFGDFLPSLRLDFNAPRRECSRVNNLSFRPERSAVEEPEVAFRFVAEVAHSPIHPPVELRPTSNCHSVRNDVLYAAAVITALITLVSASFGGRSSRLLLWGAALVQLVLAYLAVLQNAV